MGLFEYFDKEKNYKPVFVVGKKEDIKQDNRLVDAWIGREVIISNRYERCNWPRWFVFQT